MTSGFWFNVEMKFVNKISTWSTSPLRNRSLREFRNGPRLGKQRRVLVGELSRQIALGPGDELRPLCARP